MGHRLSKIYTKTGDQGTTAVSDGFRISKSHPRICALGSLDQLNATIGLLLTETLPQPIQLQLQRLQHFLFDIGSELSMPELISVTQDDIQALENDIDRMNAQLQPLKEFILPGGSKPAAMCHVARTLCRTTETQLIQLTESSPTTPLRGELLAYINRLSDWLFVAARSITYAEGNSEILWKNPYTRPQVQ